MVPRPRVKNGQRQMTAAGRAGSGLCSLCGLCVQTCPVSSLAFSKDVYLAGGSRKDFEFDLLKRLRDRAGSARLKKAA